MNAKRIQNLMLDLVYDVVGSLIFGLGLYTFAREGGFATGGFSGLGLMLNHLTSLPIGMLTLLLNIPLIILSYRTLGRFFLLKTLKTMIIQTLILDLVMPLFPTYRGNPLIAALFTGVLMGAGLGIIYMRGSSTGGSDFLILSLHKVLPHLSVGQFSLMIDFVILILGALVYGNIDAALYGLISTFACSQVMDRVLYGAGSGKMAIIITNHGMETAQAISDEIERGSTLIKAIGTYSGDGRDMLLCACSKNQIFKVRAAAHKVDERAMVMITEVDEVYGEGFKSPEEKK